MKKIIVMAFIAMMALTGIASASYSLDILSSSGQELPNPVYQAVGTPVTYDLELGNFSGKEVHYELYYNSSDLIVTVLNTASFTVDSDDYIDDDAISVEIIPGANGVMAATIDIYIDDYYAQSVDFRAASASQEFTAAIPEYPTIALPVAAIIGLAFFMQRRKEE